MNTNELELAKQIILKQMPHVPKAQILQDLGIVIERLRFVPEARELLQHADSQQFQTSMSYLFQNDVSADMRHCIVDLHSQGFGRILAEESGDEFYQHCVEYFSQLKEIRVITAVKLSPSFEQHLALQLNRDAVDTTRVVYEVLPSITGGCMIVDENGRTTDYSFKTNVTFYTHRFLSRKLEELRS